MSPNRRARRALSLSRHNQRFPRVHKEDHLLDSRRAHAIEHSRDDSIPGPGVGSNLDFSFRSMAYTFADRDRKAVDVRAQAIHQDQGTRSGLHGTNVPGSKAPV